ncbi:MAG: polysaccharide biosynthesis/export family protein [Planctomycetota bacterium]
MRTTRHLFPAVRVGLVVLVGFTGVGCRDLPPPRPAPPPARSGPAVTSVAQAPKGFTFRFSVGDELGIDVWQEKELSTVQRVLPDGTVSLPLLGGVRMAGRTVDEAREILTRRYREYLKEPKVSVRVTNIYSDRVFVLGEVNEAQAVNLVGPLTLTQAIAEAKGFDEETAQKAQVRLVRLGPDGRPQVSMIDVKAILSGYARDVPLRRGDLVYVPAKGVTNWSRDVGQALAPFAIALSATGSAAAILVAAR